MKKIYFEDVNITNMIRLNNIKYGLSPFYCHALFFFYLSLHDHEDIFFGGLNNSLFMGYFFEMQHCMLETFINRLLLYTICKDFYRAQSRIWYELVFF